MTTKATDTETIYREAMARELPECDWCLGEGGYDLGDGHEACGYCDGTGKRGGEVGVKALAGLKKELKIYYANYIDTYQPFDRNGVVRIAGYIKEITG